MFVCARVRRIPQEFLFNEHRSRLFPPGQRRWVNSLRVCAQSFNSCRLPARKRRKCLSRSVGLSLGELERRDVMLSCRRGSVCVCGRCHLFESPKILWWFVWRLKHHSVTAYIQVSPSSDRLGIYIVRHLNESVFQTTNSGPTTSQLFHICTQPTASEIYYVTENMTSNAAAVRTPPPASLGRPEKSVNCLLPSCMSLHSVFTDKLQVLAKVKSVLKSGWKLPWTKCLYFITTC